MADQKPPSQRTRKRHNALRPATLADTPLTERETLFVRYFQQSFNGTEAAKAAGFSKRTAYAIAYALLRKPNIIAELHKQREARLERIDLTLDQEVRQLWDGATLDVSLLFDERGHLRPLETLPLFVRQAIVSVETTEKAFGEKVTKVKLMDKARLHELLAKHVGIGGDAIPTGPPPPAFALPAGSPGVRVH